MNISIPHRLVCFTLLVLAAPFPAAAQKGFTDAYARPIQALLRDNFADSLLDWLRSS